jgi:hypothetical protein
MGPSDQEEQADKRRVMLQDADVRANANRSDDTGTFLSHAQAQADEINQGRFAALGTPHMVGSTLAPSYPAASAHQRDPVPDEPPLGFAIDAMPELEPNPTKAEARSQEE